MDNGDMYDYEGLQAGYYDFQRKSLRKRWHDKKFELVKQIALDNNPNLILDFGCGPGVFLRDFIPSNVFRIGFDISIAQVNYANQFSSSTLVFIHSLDEISKLLASFDIEQLEITIVAIELIEHINDSDLQSLFGVIEQLLQEYSHKSVRWIFTTPNKISFWPGLERIVDLVLGTDYREQHKFLCSAKTLNERLNRVSELDFTVQSFMTITGWLIRKKKLRVIKALLFRGLLLISWNR